MSFARRTNRDIVIEASTPQPAPRWALLERQLLDAQARAIEQYFARYFDERGYLLCVPRWGGDSNFLPIVARTKALPALLEDVRERLVEHWPGAAPTE